MARILAYTSPAIGHLFPMCALLAELGRRGHAVWLRTLSDGVPVGADLGFNTDAIDPRIEAVVSADWTSQNSRAVLQMTIDVFGRRGAHEIADLRDAAAVARPDLLIIDTNCWGAIAAAGAGRLPWVVFSPYTPFLTSRGVPPAGAGMKPLPGVLGRVRDAGVRTVVRRIFDAPMLVWLNQFCVAVGCPQVRSVDEYLRRAPLTLVASGEPFEYPHPDWGLDVVMIGPCDFDRPAQQVPEWVSDLEGPVILVTASSVKQADDHLVMTALAALADEPVRVVATCPAGVPPGIEVPANATVCEFVPHGPVLDRAVCVVNHGGMGVTQKALSRGVPVCVVPHGRDQFEVARRVQVARCGTRLPAKRLTADRLRARVRQAMGMAAGARRVAAGFAATGGVAHGADLIEYRMLGRDLGKRNA